MTDDKRTGAGYGPGSMALFCDASYDSRTQASGWSSWARRQEWRGGVFNHGRFAKQMLSSNEAEIAAIANALCVQHAEGGLENLTSVMVQSDCVTALGQILHWVPGTVDRSHGSGMAVRRVEKVSETELRAVEVIARRIGLLGISLVVRHVKGHTKNSDGRSWVNRRCDDLAKANMRQHRRELRQLEKEGL